jgi:Family of unknown function (DUF6283)
MTCQPGVPCGSCPYRRDVPSGVWAEDEYAKLPPYDLSTPEQPTGLFMCHQQDGRVCSGWAGTHDMDENLALRFAAASGSISPDDYRAILEYESPVPLFASGAEAAEHGLAEVETPGSAAVRTIQKLERKRATR